MTYRYITILVLYALASFGAILALTEAALWLVRQPLLRMLERFRPTDSVKAHLVWRLLPPIIALLLTSLSALPGYLHGEPIETRELPGLSLIGLALLGLYSIVAPLVQVVWISLRTDAKTRTWLQSAVRRDSFSRIPVVELALSHPVIVASGLIRKFIFVSSPVKSLLSARELRAALRHEVAHCRQNHNLAKLLWTAAPRIAPAVLVEENLRETIEFAADDEACSIPGDALNLASALVIMAQQSAPPTEMLYTPLVAASETARLERRVQRLVLPAPRSGSGKFAQLALACVLIVSVTVFIGSLPIAQHAFQEMLELLVQ